MKKLLSLVLVLSAFDSVYAQDYFPMPDSNAIWRANWSNNTCINLGLPLSQYQYLLTGDTIINSKEYIKIARTGFISPYCPPYSYGRQQTGYQGAYRNDITEKTVYYVFPDSTDEILLYDFSLSAGDTVKGYFSIPEVAFCQDLLVLSVDTIILNDQPRRRLNVAGTPCESYFIEGIGSTHGLLESPQTMEEAGELICFTQNDTLIYLSNSFETCEVINSSEEDLMQEKVNVRPNPATDILNIGMPDGNTICSIELFDLLGNTRLQISLNPGCTKQTLDVRDLPKGCYILKVYSTNGSCKAMKVVAGSR